MAPTTTDDIDSDADASAVDQQRAVFETLCELVDDLSVDPDIDTMDQLADEIDLVAETIDSDDVDIRIGSGTAGYNASAEVGDLSVSSSINTEYHPDADARVIRWSYNAYVDGHKVDRDVLTAPAIPADELPDDADLHTSHPDQIAVPETDITVREFATTVGPTVMAAIVEHAASQSPVAVDVADTPDLADELVRIPDAEY